jgi:hypothetical protein
MLYHAPSVQESHPLTVTPAAVTIDPPNVGLVGLFALLYQLPKVTSAMALPVASIAAIVSLIISVGVATKESTMTVALPLPAICPLLPYWYEYGTVEFISYKASEVVVVGDIGFIVSVQLSPEFRVMPLPQLPPKVVL